jgi:hypothetical protein
MGEKRSASRISMGKQEGKKPLEDLDIGGWIILKCILERYVGVVWIGFIWLKIWTNGGLL